MASLKWRESDVCFVGRSPQCRLLVGNLLTHLQDLKNHAACVPSLVRGNAIQCIGSLQWCLFCWQVLLVPGVDQSSWRPMRGRCVPNKPLLQPPGSVKGGQGEWLVWLLWTLWTGGVACPQTQVSAKQATAASCSPLAPSNLYDPCSTSFSNRQLSAKYAGKPDGYSVQV